MPRKTKNIYKRKDGRWEGRYPNGKKDNGSTRYFSVYGKTYSEVKEKLDSLSKQQKIIKKCNKHTFSEVLDSWMLLHALNQRSSTRLKYENIISLHIKPELGGYHIQDINELLIIQFIEKKRQEGRIDGTGGLSASYITTMIVIINSAIEYAVEQDYRLPMKKAIAKPKCEYKEITILSQEEYKNFEQHLLEEKSLDALGVILSLNMGLRIGEICSLRWEDIDLQTNILHVRSTISRIKNTNLDTIHKTILVVERPKTKSSIRDIPITSKISHILSYWKARSNSEFVISTKETFISPRTYEYRFHKLLKRYDVSDINYHALRHTFATRCIENGIDVKTLSELLGHANVNITLNTYVHSSMERKRQQLEKLL